MSALSRKDKLARANKLKQDMQETTVSSYQSSQRPITLGYEAIIQEYRGLGDETIAERITIRPSPLGFQQQHHPFNTNRNHNVINNRLERGTAETKENSTAVFRKSNKSNHFSEDSTLTVPPPRMDSLSLITSSRVVDGSDIFARHESGPGRSVSYSATGFTAANTGEDSAFGVVPLQKNTPAPVTKGYIASETSTSNRNRITNR